MWEMLLIVLALHSTVTKPCNMLVNLATNMPSVIEASNKAVIVGLSPSSVNAIISIASYVG